MNQLVFDSRKIEKNDVFVAQKGVSVDGHLYIEKAISLGATVIICEDFPSDKKQGVTYIQVEDANVALAIMASNFYENPSSKFAVVGVTGTNGKTTIASLLYQLFHKAGYKVGLLSTVKILVDETEFKATHTTPDSVTINMYLDYHATFAEYRDVKKSFFDSLPKSAFALTNIDDKNGDFMLQNTKAKKKTYALKTLADYKSKILEKQISGTLISVDGTEVWTKLIGVFNIYNLTAIIATAELLGLEKLEILTIVSQLESVSGRFQYVMSDDGITAIIDYAHTPDALKNVLETINDIRTGNEKVITVVGCGGDRDKTKRPKMAHIASQLSSQAIFTSDNPRTENAQTILDEMEVGVAAENYRKTLTVLDRRQAIKTACKLSETGDIILIAGKGHENYQEINGIRSHFDDLEEVANCFNQLKKN